MRAITSLNGTIYIGGDFDHWNGTARAHVGRARLQLHRDVLEPGRWRPRRFVRALVTDGSAMYIGGDIGQVAAVDTSAGSTLWAQTISGGSVHALLATNGVLYVGGLFETYGNTSSTACRSEHEQRNRDPRVQHAPTR